MKTFSLENMKVLGVIVLSILVKWLLTDTPPSEDEPDAVQRVRTRRNIGGALAGFVIAFFGYEWVIFRVDALTSDDAVMVAIVLALTGEHIVRAVLSIDEKSIKAVVMARLKGSGK